MENIGTGLVFTGKRALVVGGSGGIGKAVALGLAKRGALVTITGGSSKTRLEMTLAELNTFGANGNSATGFLCTIGGKDGLSPEKAAASILEKAGSPDILVVAWGPFKKCLLVETKSDDWLFLVENNLIFPGIMVSSVLCDMINKGWGRILLFGGTKTADIRGFSDTAAYAAAKTALGTLAKSVAKCAGKDGISCNVICPGLTGTEYTSQEDLAWYREKNPGGRLLAANEIACCALGVLENPVVNGTIIAADGGLWV